MRPTTLSDVVQADVICHHQLANPITLQDSTCMAISRMLGPHHLYSLLRGLTATVRVLAAALLADLSSYLVYASLEVRFLRCTCW